MGILFILKFYARVGIFTKIFCIWKRLFLKSYFCKKCILILNFQNCQKCLPQFSETSCPQKFLATRLVYIYIYMHIYICICIYIYVYIYIYILYIYIYIVTKSRSEIYEVPVFVQVHIMHHILVRLSDLICFPNWFKQR